MSRFYGGLWAGAGGNDRHNAIPPRSLGADRQFALFCRPPVDSGKGD